MKHLGLIILLSGPRLLSMTFGKAVLPSLSCCQMSWEHRTVGKQLWDSSFPRSLSPCRKCSCFFSISDQTESSFASEVFLVCLGYCWVQLMISIHFRLILFFLFNNMSFWQIPSRGFCFLWVEHVGTPTLFYPPIQTISF